jgi:kinetochore protein NNF1
MDLDQPVQNGEHEEQVGEPPIQSSAPDRRAAQLNQLFEGAATATLNKVNYSNFSSCFPTPAEYKPDVLKRFWADFVGRLGDKWRVSSDIQCWTLVLSKDDY